MDCTIRLWSPTGMYIGTLGQEEIWNLYDTKTYKHPHVPYDVLIDYKSVPEHPLIDQVQTTAEVLLAHKLMDASDNDKEVCLFFSLPYVLAVFSLSYCITNNQSYYKLYDMNLIHIFFFIVYFR